MRFTESLFKPVLLALLMAAAAACAPEPTTPATSDLSGNWAANAHLFTLSEMKVRMVQQSEGLVSGSWTAQKGDGGGGGCRPAVPCDASGGLVGRNTVSQVELELLGAGKFEGALVEDDRLRGVFLVGQDYDTITFVRVTR